MMPWLLFGLLCVLSLSGFVMRGGDTVPPVTTGTGTLQIETLGEHTTQPIATAPYLTVWTDGQTPTLKNKTMASIPTGNVWARTQNPRGLVPYVGTCTYAEGGGGCTVASYTRMFSLPSAQWGCDVSSCRYQTAVTGGQVTKVSFKWQGEYEGFGASTVGGRSGTVCTVTSLGDRGAGTLRECLSNGAAPGNQGTYQDNVYVVFAVAGDINLSNPPTTGYGPIRIKGKNITIDGYTAPGNVDINRYGIYVMNAVTKTPPVVRDVHDVIIRNIAIRDMDPQSECCPGNPCYDGSQACISGWGFGIYTGESGERISDTEPGPYNVVIANTSVSHSLREPYTTTFADHDLTAQFNVFTHQKGFHQGTLFDWQSTKISFHHNVLSNTGARNPQIVWGRSAAVDSNTTADHRFNTYGMAPAPNGSPSFWGLNITHGSKVNAVNNYFIGLPAVNATINVAAQRCDTPDNAGDSCGSGSAETINAGLKPSWSFCYGPGGGGNSNNWQGSCGKPENLCDIYGQFPAGGVFSSGNVITSAFNPAPPCNINQNTPNVSAPYAAPAITGGTALQEACLAKAIGGRWPRDSWDTAELNLLQLSGCPAYSIGSGV